MWQTLKEKEGLCASQRQVAGIGASLRHPLKLQLPLQFGQRMRQFLVDIETPTSSLELLSLDLGEVD
jgi:hypothetical protein